MKAFHLMISRGITLLMCGLTITATAQDYTLEEAITAAQTNDPWQKSSRFKQQSLEAQSISEASLPDPQISFGLANAPIDSFDLNQEPMTQMVVGIQQVLPRGDTLALRQKHFKRLGDIQPYDRENRLAEVYAIVSALWLDAYRSARTIGFIKRDRNLFEHLVDVAESNYTSGSGSARQNNVIRAQLELTRLDDRLLQLQQMLDVNLAQLALWLPAEDVGIDLPPSVALQLDLKAVIQSGHKGPNSQLIHQVLQSHPRVKSIDKAIEAQTIQVDLANQSYKPQWKLNSQFGWRQDDPMGNSRSDFLSIGVGVDLPVFTKNRQDKQVLAATARTSAMKSNRALVLRALLSDFEAAEAQYKRLKQRQKLFAFRLLSAMDEQVETSLTAYTNDEGEFSDVVRARISQLNAKIEALNIHVDLQKQIVNINYFVSGYLKKNINNQMSTLLYSNGAANE